MTTGERALLFRLVLSPPLVPERFTYPPSFTRFAKGALPNLTPWRFLCAEEPEYFVNGLRKRYPSRRLVPFARRDDNDDVACFDAADTSGDPRVLFIHDFADPGWELRGTAENFEHWLRVAVDESANG